MLLIANCVCAQEFQQQMQSLLQEYNDRIPIVIATAEVNDVVNNGHFGGYVADILMEQMLLNDNVRLLDRSVLNEQIDEINLSGVVLDPNTTIKKAQGIGARYILKTTMQKPDVVNTSTGIPLASVMGAVQGITGVNIGAAYASNLKPANLRASVSISVRVVDLQTGEVMFMCSGKGEAKGKSQLAMEYGALGGAVINGGVEGFRQTITGKAVQQAFITISSSLKTFFDGKTTQKVVNPISGSGFSQFDRLMYSRGYDLYLGTNKLNKEDVPYALSEHPNLFFQYQQALKKRRTSRWIGFGAGIVFLGLGAADAAIDTTAASYALMGVGGLCIVTGITINKSGKKQIQRIAESYNFSNATYSYLSQTQKSTTLSFTGNGIRVTF